MDLPPLHVRPRAACVPPSGLVRVRLPEGLLVLAMNETIRSRRFQAGVTLALLSAITGIISYQHGLSVARLVGNHGLVAYLIPLVPDLMIVGASLTLIEAAAIRARPPQMTILALVAGIGWTVVMNVAAGWRNGPGGAALAGMVPLAFVATFESLLWLLKRARGGTLPRPAPGTPIQDEPPSTSEALRTLLDTDSRRKLADALGVPKSRVDTWAASVRAPAELADAGLNGHAPQ